jgi:hypothetical protein
MNKRTNGKIKKWKKLKISYFEILANIANIEGHSPAAQ